MTTNGMVSNTAMQLSITALAAVIVPLQIVSTLILGLAVALTFGLLLIPLSVLWVVVLAPVLAISWVGERVPAIREAIGFLCLPWVVVVYAYACMMPSMGELDSRAVKLILCESWPFTWQVWRYFRGEFDRWPQISAVILRITEGDPARQRALRKIQNGVPLDAN